MPKIPATEFKAKCLELMNRVAERNETYVITKRGRPVARLAPLEHKPKESIFGWLRQDGSIVGDVVGPVIPPRSWESLAEWGELSAANNPQGAAGAIEKSKTPRRRR